DVETIHPDSSIKDASEKMAKLSVGALTVKDNDNVIGIITDRDIVVRAIAKGMDPEQAKVNETMTPEVVYSFEDQEVEEATEKMKKQHVRRLLVLNRNKKPVGMVSLVPY
nr:CBS domain-containing protein [Fodinibius sp.]